LYNLTIGYIIISLVCQFGWYNSDWQAHTASIGQCFGTENDEESETMFWAPAYSENMASFRNIISLSSNFQQCFVETYPAVTDPFGIFSHNQMWQGLRNPVQSH
jgi:hypothetical protein